MEIDMDRTKALRYCAWLLSFALLLILPVKSPAQLDSDAIRGAPVNVLFIYGNVAHTVAIDSKLIRTMPQVQVKMMGGDNSKTETYSGVPLKNLLIRAGVTAAESLSLAAVGNDGNKVALSPAETDAVFQDGSQIIVADAMNGKSLDASNGPLMLIVSGDKGSAHWVRNLARIQVNTAK
jgi:hypothetical protein